MLAVLLAVPGAALAQKHNSGGGGRFAPPRTIGSSAVAQFRSSVETTTGRIHGRFDAAATRVTRRHHGRKHGPHEHRWIGTIMYGNYGSHGGSSTGGATAGGTHTNSSNEHVRQLRQPQRLEPCDGGTKQPAATHTGGDRTAWQHGNRGGVSNTTRQPAHARWNNRLVCRR